jgi:hypothetical protein
VIVLFTFALGAAAGIVARRQLAPRHRLRRDPRLGRLPALHGGAFIEPPKPCPRADPPAADWRSQARAAHAQKLAEIRRLAGVTPNDPPTWALAKLRQAEYHDAHHQGSYLDCPSCRAERVGSGYASEDRG